MPFRKHPTGTRYYVSHFNEDIRTWETVLTSTKKQDIAYYLNFSNYRVYAIKTDRLESGQLHHVHVNISKSEKRTLLPSFPRKRKAIQRYGNNYPLFPDLIRK